jgi:cell wall-associated NlpC family hydrolase
MAALLLRGITGKTITGLAVLVAAVAVLGGATLVATPLTGTPGTAAATRACGYADQLPAPGDAGLGLNPEQKSNAQTITRLATDLDLPVRAAVIAMATAWTESHLDQHAVGDHGHAFGLFQQHPDQGWGTRAQVTDPAYATRAFYTALVAVPGWQTLPLTIAAQAVQRSAHPRAYAPHEARAKRIVAAVSTDACAAATPPPATGSDADNRSKGQIAAQAALAWLGTPYSWGGGNATGPTRGICCSTSGADGRTTIGFDCSGLTLYAWAKAGVRLAHYTGTQINQGTPVKRADLRAGDLIFFGPAGEDPTHVGIYLADGVMIHAPTTGQTVKKTNFLHSAYYMARYRGAIRP